MDFGVFLDFSRRKGSTHAQIFREAFELVDIAEETGLDTIWLGESHFNPNRSVMSAPIVVASSIATRTKRLRVGMAVQVLPLISPLRIAEEAATVDQISQGRFEFGVGRSGNQRAYEIMGMKTAMQTGWSWHALSSRLRPDAGDFGRISREEGLKAALSWRDKPFHDEGLK